MWKMFLSWLEERCCVQPGEQGAASLPSTETSEEGLPAALRTMGGGVGVCECVCVRGGV